MQCSNWTFIRGFILNTTSLCTNYLGWATRIHFFNLIFLEVISPEIVMQNFIYIQNIGHTSMWERERDLTSSMVSLTRICICNFLSIEYWPDPQRGVKEAYRVLKLGGKACLIGPVYPTFWLSRFFADAWMLFPKEEEYIEWFKKAGFKDVQLKRIGPKWYRGVRRHGLIMGCSVTGVKPASGDSPLQVIISGFFSN